MSDVLLSLVATYGTMVIAISTFLSCLALPIPSSLVMLAGGAFAASGDLSLTGVVLAAFGGAVLGDQTGYRAGRIGGPALFRALRQKPGRVLLVARAEGILERWGGIGVFLSTCLVAPLGPWVNLAAGAAGMGAVRFTLWDAMGDAIWVLGYTGLGWVFGAQFTRIAALMGNATLALAALAVTVFLGIALLHNRKT